MEQKNDLTQLQKVVNRQVNLAYIIAGCFQLACEDMTDGLKSIRSDLNFENKKLVGEILRESKRLNYLINKLEEVSILKNDLTEEDVYIHDDAEFKYYTILMKIVQIAGSDSLTVVRLMKIYDILSSMKDRIDFNKLESLEWLAFRKTREDVIKGKWDKKKIMKCIEMVKYDEYKSKTTESKA